MRKYLSALCFAVLFCLALPLAARAAATDSQLAGSLLVSELIAMPDAERDSYLATIQQVDRLQLGMTALMFACSNNDDETSAQVVGALLRRGADPTGIRFDASTIAKISNPDERKVMIFLFKMKTVKRMLLGERDLNKTRPEYNFDKFNARDFARSLGYTRLVQVIDASQGDKQ